jgi:hypothetical protein
MQHVLKLLARCISQVLHSDTELQQEDQSQGTNGLYSSAYRAMYMYTLTLY